MVPERMGRPSRDSVAGTSAVRRTSCSESTYGSGLKTRARTTLKMAVLAPMPSVSVITATAANAGARRIIRPA
jgi:hypothetical protein